ncbi:MAG: hypothetical protein KDA41_22085, partial [Planctomycetales bacterium]|nr:hypothetical protein [Planctomycetales bacterium]
MRAASVLIALVSVALCLPAACAQQATGASTDRPLATRQNFFTIPFTAPAGRTGAPLEVQLFVSSDHGRNWQLYGRQQPGAGKFQFRAGSDGEYWFASRTIDAQGIPQPTQAHQAELKVVVDTTSPQLDLEATIGP